MFCINVFSLHRIISVFCLFYCFCHYIVYTFCNKFDNLQLVPSYSLSYFIFVISTNITFKRKLKTFFYSICYP